MGQGDYQPLKTRASASTWGGLQSGAGARLVGVEEVTVVVVPAIKEQILSDLGRLSPAQQERAARLVHELVSPMPRGASVEDLLKVAGTLDDEAAREMMEAVEEGCERVDLDEW